MVAGGRVRAVSRSVWEAARASSRLCDFCFSYHGGIPVTGRDNNVNEKAIKYFIFFYIIQAAFVFRIDGITLREH